MLCMEFSYFFFLQFFISNSKFFSLKKIYSNIHTIVMREAKKKQKTKKCWCYLCKIGFAFVHAYYRLCQQGLNLAAKAKYTFCVKAQKQGFL